MSATPIPPRREIYPELNIVHPQGKAAMDEVFSIRRKVFIDEQGVSEVEEYDEFEDSSQHVLVLQSATPVAAARWRPTDQGVKIERMAVLQEWRERGIGSAMLRWILHDIKVTIGRIYLHAQRHAVVFYERNGFKVEGDTFIEADIEHVRMYYTGAAAMQKTR